MKRGYTLAAGFLLTLVSFFSGVSVAHLRRSLIAPAVALAVLAGPQIAHADPDPDTSSPSPQQPGPSVSPLRESPQIARSPSAQSTPNAAPSTADPDADSTPSQEPLEILDGKKKGKEPSAEQRQEALADSIAKKKAQEAARTAVAEARMEYEKALAKHRLNKAKIERLIRDSQRAEQRAARTRRDMGNMARLAYSSGDTDMNLLAALLEAKSPEEVLSGASTAARVASHKDSQWNDALLVQARADRLAAEAEILLDRSSKRLAAAKSGVKEAMALADAVDLAVEPLTKVPPVDLTTKSDWVFPTATGQIDSEAGMRLHPILRYVRCHAGADISAPAGTPIYAVDNGVVLTAGTNGGYGNYTLIAHGNGLTSAYAHQQLILVKNGDRVTRGQLIGEVGTTGLSTGAHLHFEALHHGVPYDPRGWLDDRPERRVPVCR